MKYEWIDEYLLKMPGVSKDLQKDWNWIRYRIGEKMFVAICLDEFGQIGQILGKHLFYGKIRFLMLLSLALKLKSIDFSGLRGCRCFFRYY